MNQNRKKLAVTKKLLPVALAVALTVSGTAIPVKAQDIVGANNNHYIMKQTAIVANESIKNIEFASDATKKSKLQIQVISLMMVQNKLLLETAMI